MKTIMIMYDTLIRRLLPPYGCSWVKAPNFQRLAERSVVFDNAYVGSMPCMPARREIHTGRYNFLHRSWGPLEPFDDSMPELLKKNGVYSHLVSDHYHYWEDGGATYHSRYSSWEISRGQEGDPWKGEVKDPVIPDCVVNRKGNKWRQDWVNRQYLEKEKDQPMAKTFAAGLEFLRKNINEDNWFLQIETFDPHEPFFTQDKYKALYPHNYNGRHFDWPEYDIVRQNKDEVDHLRYEYAALLSMCDDYLGTIIDYMDSNDMWRDTMLIVNTDHGFLLGEHNWWAKSIMPFYNEIAHMPLFIWDPRSGIKGERREALVQTIDLAPTILSFFNVEIPADMQGHDLDPVIRRDDKVREAALFGTHGSHVNCTDGRYVYMRAPKDRSNRPLFNYTLMPTHMNTMFSVSELQEIELSQPFAFSKGCKLLRIPAEARNANRDELNFPNRPTILDYGTMLFDTVTDPMQENPIVDDKIEAVMKSHMVKLMKDNDAPVEVYERLGLSQFL